MTVARRGSADQAQRAEFTGLGRHLRVTGHGSVLPLRVAEVTVFGTR